jgi:GAF domain-containing protein
LNIRSAALIPVWRTGTLYCLYLLGTRDEAQLNPLTIQPYVSLATQVSTTIDKVLAMGNLHRRVAGLQSLASISQAISVVSDFNDLFGLIHEKISQVMGEIDLAIALYDPKTDTISIPYAYEAGEQMSLPPFPLGQGLTSILIRTRQPLMLVEDTEKKSLELGAKISGAPAKSWLGVPLIVGNEVLGAIIVQDAENEHRFDLDDLRLMTTLAAQIAITLRNIRLYQDAREYAERERLLAEITNRIWASPDIESIARTALEELGRAMRASAGSIELSGKMIEASSQMPYLDPDRVG